MCVADLLAAVAVQPAGGLLAGLDEAGVGGEVLDGREADDVADLVVDREGTAVFSPRFVVTNGSLASVS